MPISPPDSDGSGSRQRGRATIGSNPPLQKSLQSVRIWSSLVPELGIGVPTPFILETTIRVVWIRGIDWLENDEIAEMRHFLTIVLLYIAYSFLFSYTFKPKLDYFTNNAIFRPYSLSSGLKTTLIDRFRSVVIWTATENKVALSPFVIVCQSPWIHFVNLSVGLSLRQKESRLERIEKSICVWYCLKEIKDVYYFQ